MLDDSLLRLLVVPPLLRPHAAPIDSSNGWHLHGWHPGLRQFSTVTWPHRADYDASTTVWLVRPTNRHDPALNRSLLDTACRLVLGLDSIVRFPLGDDHLPKHDFGDDGDPNRKRLGTCRTKSMMLVPPR